MLALCPLCSGTLIKDQYEGLHSCIDCKRRFKADWSTGYVKLFDIQFEDDLNHIGGDDCKIDPFVIHKGVWIKESEKKLLKELKSKYGSKRK